MNRIDLRHLADAADNLDAVLSTSQLLSDPDGIGQHLTCSEADAFADLLKALELHEHAHNLLEQHARGDDDDEDDDPEHLALRAQL